MMMIMMTTVINTKIIEAAVAEEDHKSGKGGGGDMIQYTPSAFRKGNLEGFDGVAMHVARAVLLGSRVYELYTRVGVLGLMPLSYLHCMSKVD